MGDLVPEDTEALLKATQAVLVFADGLCVSETGRTLADLYAEDYAPAQEALRAAGCWPRGSFKNGPKTAQEDR